MEADQRKYLTQRLKRKYGVACEKLKSGGYNLDQIRVVYDRARDSAMLDDSADPRTILHGFATNCEFLTIGKE